jgi:hypothetical protein
MGRRTTWPSWAFSIFISLLLLAPQLGGDPAQDVPPRLGILPRGEVDDEHAELLVGVVLVLRDVDEVDALGPEAGLDVERLSGSCGVSYAAVITVLVIISSPQLVWLTSSTIA